MLCYEVKDWVTILISTFKAYHEIGPEYLTDFLIKYTPSRTLPSTNKGLLASP